MERKLGINCDCIGRANEIESLKIIKEIGFHSTFCNFNNEKPIKHIKEQADKLSLNFEFLHAPFIGINAMWKNGDEYLNIYEGMKNTIICASDNDIPAVVLHTSSGWTPPNISDIGLKRFNQLIDLAKDKKITVLFENLRSIPHVTYFIDNYKDNDTVKFCFDTGHAYCYTHPFNWVNAFNKNLKATHIHDNHGFIETDGDEHLLPLDGTLDFSSFIASLNNIGYTGSLMLEVFNSSSPVYSSYSPKEFIKLSYDRLTKISK